jgi:hypothetical protein
MSNQTTPAALNPPVNPPAFEQDVYSVSPYGAAVLMNSSYYAGANAANALAQLYDATPAAALGSPELPALQRWATVEVPTSLLPAVAGGQVATMAQLQDLLTLPAVRQWVLMFANGTIMNAGYLAGYWQRNPPSAFPGLADKFCRAILAAEGITLPPAAQS